MTSRPCIVVGVDNTPSSAAALRWAAGEARRIGAHVRAIHVWQCSEAAEHQNLPNVERDEVHENLTRWIVNALTRTGWDVDVSMEILDGNPGPTLVCAAAEAALLVLGSNTFAASGLPASSVVDYCKANSPARVVVIDGRDRRIPNPRIHASAS